MKGYPPERLYDCIEEVHADPAGEGIVIRYRGRIRVTNEYMDHMVELQSPDAVKTTAHAAIMNAKRWYEDVHAFD